MVVGGLVLLGALAAIVVVAATSLQGNDPAAAGVAGLEDQDLTDVSNETMEAVIAANADHPEVDGMRLALAERYFEGGEYGSAVDHYVAVADSPSSTSPQRTTSLIRMGWIAYYGGADADAALIAFDRALEIDPTAQTALYLKAQVLWCGLENHESAAAILAAMLDDPDLPADARAQVEQDLSNALSGADCT